MAPSMADEDAGGRRAERGDCSATCRPFARGVPLRLEFIGVDDDEAAAWSKLQQVSARGVRIFLIGTASHSRALVGIGSGEGGVGGAAAESAADCAAGDVGSAKAVVITVAACDGMVTVAAYMEGAGGSWNESPAAAGFSARGGVSLRAGSVTTGAASLRFGGGARLGGGSTGALRICSWNASVGGSRDGSR